MQEHNKKSDVHDSVPFLAKYTGYIIGTEGRGIQNLRKRSGVNRAWVDNKHHVHFRDEWSYLHVVGHPMNNDAAKCLLMQRIRDADSGIQREAREDPRGSHRHHNDEQKHF